VAAEWGSITYISCYASSRWSLIEFADYLELGVIVTDVASRPLLMAGDLNAKSPAWGSAAESPRGEALRVWVESLGLYILNVGRVSTCVRHNGESTVDVTIGSPMMARTINGWRVVTDTETLSDHLYIQMNIGGVSGRPVHRPPQESRDA